MPGVCIAPLALGFLFLLMDNRNYLTDSISILALATGKLKISLGSRTATMSNLKTATNRYSFYGMCPLFQMLLSVFYVYRHVDSLCSNPGGKVPLFKYRKVEAL